MYESIYGEKPHIMVIHAGLECGLFKEPYPNMDMISFGPTIKFPHSPEEKSRDRKRRSVLATNERNTGKYSRKKRLINK